MNYWTAAKMIGGGNVPRGMKCDDPRCCPACSEAWREKLNEETKRGRGA